jgi:hypothetical protein
VVAGDYYQAMFAAEEDTDDPDSPYLLLQGQFEVPDDGECYIEMHDKDYSGHFLLRRVELTRQELLIEFDRLLGWHRVVAGGRHRRAGGSDPRARQTETQATARSSAAPGGRASPCG